VAGRERGMGKGGRGRYREGAGVKGRGGEVDSGAQLESDWLRPAPKLLIGKTFRE